MFSTLVKASARTAYGTGAACFHVGFAWAREEGEPGEVAEGDLEELGGAFGWGERGCEGEGDAGEGGVCGLGGGGSRVAGLGRLEGEESDWAERSFRGRSSEGLRCVEGRGRFWAEGDDEGDGGGFLRFGGEDELRGRKKEVRVRCLRMLRGGRRKDAAAQATMGAATIM